MNSEGLCFFWGGGTSKFVLSTNARSQSLKNTTLIIDNRNISFKIVYQFFREISQTDSDSDGHKNA